MFGVDWGDPQTLWLNLTNLALGIITILAVLLVAGSVGHELLARRRKASQIEDLDSELKSLVGGSAHVLPVPELGLTMADGGEPLLRPPDSKAEKKRQTK
jgi:hypothetical protein